MKFICVTLSIVSFCAFQLKTHAISKARKCVRTFMCTFARTCIYRYVCACISNHVNECIHRHIVAHQVGHQRHTRADFGPFLLTIFFYLITIRTAFHALSYYFPKVGHCKMINVFFRNPRSRSRSRNIPKTINYQKCQKKLETIL